MKKSGCALGWLLKFLGNSSESDASAGDSLGPLPYKGKDFIFSRAERSFYEVLKLAGSTEYTVFAKVHMLDLVYFPKGTEKQQSLRNRV